MERRTFLRGLGMAACSAAAHPMLTTLTMAAGAGLGENRLIVVILRGGMDGLDVVRPVGDPGYAALRPGLGAVAPAGLVAGNLAPADLAPTDLAPTDLALSGPFALHGGLAGLMPLWRAGSLGFVQATSTPYRDKRSHFDGQILLEAGTGMDVPAGAARDGWLNRMLQSVPGLTSETAYAIGREALPLLAGAGPSLSWTPEVRLQLSAQSQLLLDHIYHDDDLFREAGAEAMSLSVEMGEARMQPEQAAEREAADAGSGEMGAGEAPAMAVPVAPRGFADIDRLVDFAAGRLQGATRIAAFSLAGWDTHRGQAAVIGRSLSRLERIVLRLSAQLGPQVWGRTTLLAMTEFGRTVRENGSGGTDHGTGGAMLMAGGALRGGQVYGRWPGLAEADLYDRRDLMPTSDVRAWAAWTMRGLYGLDRATLESRVFPGLDMGSDPRLIL